MKIIIITEKDAANISLAKIASAFFQKNHKIRLFAPYMERSVLKDFDEDIPSSDIKNMTEEDVAWGDIIFCSTLSSIYLPEFVFRASKPIFTHNYLMNRQINWGGDICFVPSQITVASDYDDYLNYSYIGIGEPKYDHLIANDLSKEQKKRFLFIDSGHYPFSCEGKRELARTLLHICDKYPDYELVIKPRFLPGDTVLTHRNDIHLYDIIYQEASHVIPENMVMLTIHEDLQELIDQASTVICMYTTAFVGAVVSGKGLIILENLMSEDIYDIRNKTYMRCRENMLNSGALIDFREVDKLLPYGARPTTESGYLDTLLEEKNNVADKIVESCEYLWKTFYSKGLFPKICDSTYKRFKQEYSVDKDMTWEKQISKRCHDYIFLKSLILIDFHISVKLDISYVIDKVKDLEGDNGIIKENVFRNFLENVNDIRDNCIISNREILLKNDIDAGVLLNAYYLQKRYDEIIAFPVKRISAFDLFRGFVAVDISEEDSTVIEYLTRYFNKVQDRKWALEISDLSNNRKRAFNILIELLRKHNQVSKAEYYEGLMKKIL